jgi:hypothetical protein
VYPVQQGGVTFYNSSASAVATFGGLGDDKTTYVGGSLRISNDGSYAAPSIFWENSTLTGFLLQSSVSHVIGMTSNGSPIGTFANAEWTKYTYGTTPYFIAQRYNGAYGATSAVVNSDDVLLIETRPYDGVDVSNPTAAIRFQATEDHTASASGTKIAFQSTITGSNSLVTTAQCVGYQFIGPAYDQGTFTAPSFAFGSATNYGYLRATHLGLTNLWHSVAGAPAFGVGSSGATRISFSANPTILTSRIQGSYGAETAVTSGQNLGNFGCRPYDGATAINVTSPCAGFIGYAAENHTATNHGAYLEFYTTALGETSSTSRTRIDPDGIIVVGAQVNGSVKYNGQSSFITSTPIVQISSRSAGEAALALNQGSNSATGCRITGAKRRSPTWDTMTAVQSGDGLLHLTSEGADGTTFVRAADILMEVDAAVSTGIVPGRIVFQTAQVSDGALVSALTINSSQQSLFAGGSATAPSIGFSTDTDTGFYRYASNQIGVSAGGETCALFINNVSRTLSFGTYAAFYGRRANNTEASKTKVLSGDIIAVFGSEGYYDDGAGGTGHIVGAGMYIVAAEDFSSASTVGRYVQFRTVAVGGSANSVRMRLDAYGCLVTGGDNDSLATFDATRRPMLQALSDTINNASHGLAYFNDNASGPYVEGAHSRGMSVGSYVVTQAGDTLHAVYGSGVDSTAAAFRRAACVRLAQDTAAGASAVPGRISLETANSSGVLTEALRIDSYQVATFASEVYVDSTTDVTDNDAVLTAASIYTSGGIAALKKITAISTIESSAGVIGSSVTAQTTPSWGSGTPTAQGLLNTTGLNFTAPGAPGGTAVSTVFNHFGSTFLTFATNIGTVIADGYALFAYTADATTIGSGSVRLSGGLSVEKTIVATTYKLPTGVSLAAEEQFFYYEAPTNKTYALIPNASYARTMVKLSGVKTSSGTCTVKLQIDGVDASNTLNVTSSEQTLSFTDTTLAVGERLTLVVTSASAPVDLEFTLESSKS